MHLGMISLLLTLFIVNLCSCQKKSTGSNSVLVIAVEGLSGSSFSCHPFEDTERSGFQVLCNEAVRFTHAYTTSPLSQAGLGSILTGVAPLTNGLRDNVHTFLQAKIETLPEDLYRRDVSTLFIASAPTVKRYSRLHQGFENFHDNYDLNNKNFYRPISDSIRIFKHWLNFEVKNKSYFSVIHVADLLYPQVITQTELLEPRPRGVDGQLEEIDENLFSFFSFLKKSKVWDQSFIILTGLNGTTNPSRLYELPGTNLYSENVAIPLFIKPPKGREEIPHQWKVDAHVSLQDLGVTLFEIFNVKNQSISASTDPLLSGVSLLPLIRGKSDPKLNDKTILIESSWGIWSLNSSPRYSLRDDQWLVIYDKKPLIYNTVSDRNEFNKLSTKDSSYQTILNRFQSHTSNIHPAFFERHEIHLNNEILFAQYIIENEGQKKLDIINDFRPQIEESVISENFQYLVIDQLLRQKNWTQIEQLNPIWNNPTLDQVLNLKANNHAIPTSYELDPCLSLFDPMKDTANTNPHSQKICKNKNFNLLYDYLSAATEKTDSLLDQILSVVRIYELQLKMIYFDLSKGGVVLGPNTTKLKEIITYKMILNLPKYQKGAQQIEHKIGPY